MTMMEIVCLKVSQMLNLDYSETGIEFKYF